MSTGSVIIVNIISSPPKVFLVAYPMIRHDKLREYLEYRGEQKAIDKYDLREDIHNNQFLLEIGGRICYQSHINPMDRTTEEYIQEQIIGHKHGSVLEHLNYSFIVADLPRSSQLELVRHGDGTAFSFESTRFTDKHLRFVIPPHIRDNTAECDLFTDEVTELASRYYDRVKTLTDKYAELYPNDEDKTLAKKRAKEAARSILPNCLGSDGLVTMNARALRWILEARSNEHADLSIREFAYAVYREVLPFADYILADATEVAATEGAPVLAFTHSKV